MGGGQDITNLRYVGAYVFHTCRTGQMFPWRKNGPTRRRLDRAEYEEGKESFSIIFADEKCPLFSPQCPGSWGCPIRLTTTKNMTFQILLKIINAGTRLIFGASRSNLQPLARGGDAVTPPLILMRKTDAVRTDDLPNAGWNETNERGEGYGEREYAHFAAAQDWARKNCTRVG